MKINTDYPSMQNDDLLLELKKRVFVLGETTPTYVDVDLRAIYKNNEVHLGQYLNNMEGFEIKLPKKHKDIGKEVQWSENDQCDIIVVKTDHPQYRELLIQFLQSPFIFSGAFNEETPQNVYLEDYDEDGFPIVESGPLEPIIDDNLDDHNSDLLSDDYTLGECE